MRTVLVCSRSWIKCHKRAARNQPLCTTVGWNWNSEKTAVRTCCKPLTTVSLSSQGKAAMLGCHHPRPSLPHAEIHIQLGVKHQLTTHKEPDDAITQDFGSATGWCQRLLVLRETVRNSICSFHSQSCFIINVIQALPWLKQLSVEHSCRFYCVIDSSPLNHQKDWLRVITVSSNINIWQRCEVRMHRGNAADKYKWPLLAEQQGNTLALSSRSARFVSSNLTSKLQLPQPKEPINSGAFGGMTRTINSTDYGWLRIYGREEVIAHSDAVKFEPRRSGRGSFLS